MTATVAPAANPHQPVADGKFLRCAVEGCHFALFSTLNLEEEFWVTAFKTQHSSQYEPGRAPDITVDWEISACCSVCPDGIGDVDTDDDGDGVQCKECGTHWCIDGTYGERAEGDR